MHPISAFIQNPVKVSVGVLLVVMFGLIALFRMPMQLSPNVEQPTVTISTNWPGASPHEIEKEIVQEQEEQLKSVEGVIKMSSNCSDSRGTITLEFNVGTNMQEAILKVNTQLQQVPQYPVDADPPTIQLSNSEDRAIAWFILSARPADDETIRQFKSKHPEHGEVIDRILRTHNQGLKVLRLREFAEAHPEAEELLPADLDLPSYRKFAEDQIESRFERVKGVANSNVMGGENPEMQILVDPNELAARGLTLMDVRNAVNENNRDTSAGDFWEGKRRPIVRTIGEFRSAEQIRNLIITSLNGQPVYVKNVATVRLGEKKPDGFVRRFGVTNVAINCQRESGANVIDVMNGLRRETEALNNGILKREGLMLTQVYDETDYIYSAVGLVNQNIIIGGALTVIVLMMFLHMSARTLIFVPLLAGTAVAAIAISPWFFLLTLALILAAGVLFARGALVVAMAIPISIIGTFLILNLLGRSLNVISLAGLAFAVGMLVDNAVVVLENVYRYSQMGYRRMEAARMAAIEVWGAVLASTLTTLAVFLPVIFLQGEAGQLFVDIALAISAAVGLSLLVSVIVIPTASARILSDKHIDDQNGRESAGRIESGLNAFGRGLTKVVIGINRWIQQSNWRRLGVVVMLFSVAIGVAWLLMPKVEYLPQGNRNLVISFVSPPPGYNVEKLGNMGEQVELALRPYWDVDLGDPDSMPQDFPAIGDFFYVARGSSVFIGLRALDDTQAAKLIGLLQTKLKDRFPGSYVVAFQTSLFGRGLSGGRTIDVEITGPDLERLVGIGGQILGQCAQEFPGGQARPVPSLDLSSPEVHVEKRNYQANDLGVSSTELGFNVNALIDGAYVGDYFLDGEKIDLVIMGSDQYHTNTQDLKSQYVATRNMAEPVRLDAIAEIKDSAGPEQIARRERERAITIQVTPPDDLSLEETIDRINQNIIAPLESSGRLGSEYQVHLSGTADKLKQTWEALRFNVFLAILITYLLMAALFESWIYPLVIILSVPMGAVGGIIGLRLLGIYLGLRGEVAQSLDVLTMLGFVILIGTVVNNAILIVHQSLNFMRLEQMDANRAILESVRTRIRPIFMTTLTTVFGLSPLVFFPGAGSELYRGLGSVVLGGLMVSTLFTLVLVPTLFGLMMDAKAKLQSLFRTSAENQQQVPQNTSAEEVLV